MEILKREVLRPIPLTYGSLYPALNRLEKKGLIEWRWADAPENSSGARRKFYFLSHQGQLTLSLTSTTNLQQLYYL